jgi:diguanylate cyclase (GGDEF)-like protein
VVRPGDTVGRLSGDEFVVILPEVADLADAEGLAQRVTGCFGEPFRLGGKEFPVHASVGLAVHTEDGTDGRAEELLSLADAAMYRVKHEDRRRSPRGSWEPLAD